eukprot:9504082-Pyramimonas_sp.AAC.2
MAKSPPCAVPIPSPIPPSLSTRRLVLTPANSTRRFTVAGGGMTLRVCHPRKFKSSGSRWEPGA